MDGQFCSGGAIINAYVICVGVGKYARAREGDKSGKLEVEKRRWKVVQFTFKGFQR